MTVYGYVRKNYPNDTMEQIKELMKHSCDDFFIEKSPLFFDEQQRTLLATLKKGDTLIVKNLVIFGKKSSDFQQIINTIMLKDARLISLDERIDTSEQYLFTDILHFLDLMDKNLAKMEVRNYNR